MNPLMIFIVEMKTFKSWKLRALCFLDEVMAKSENNSYMHISDKGLEFLQTYVERTS